MKKKFITVKVTKKDILDGVPGSACGCPVALALKRTLKPKEISVDSGQIEASKVKIGEWQYTITGKAPRDVAKFIETFDNCFEDAPTNEEISDGFNQWGTVIAPTAVSDTPANRLKKVKPFSFKIPMP